ncbi:MAG TPA: LytTR family DNA-binding domain-containing protein [Pyrinomonadaceae bacterium]|nr:LytTR family DNA-binding domain-containing protein [Pyrinomonadaceae bacterium]
MERAKKKIKTLIVDDEPLARQNLRALLRDDPEIEILGECGSGQEALSAIEEQTPDLLFLDIQMPEMDGFEVLERIGPGCVAAIVFVTAFDQYALKAFEVHALDYLLKPFDDARFEKALRQAKAQIEQREINQLSRKLFALLEERGGAPSKTNETERATFLTRFMIKTASRVFFLKADEIDWIAADDYYVKLHAGRKSHLLRETMNELEAKLDPEKFLRIHRSTIVNIDRIKELHPHFNGDYLVILHDGTELKLSRSRRQQLQSALKK